MIQPEVAYPFSDVELARRLERAEACLNAAVVESKAKRDPASRAEWREIGGVHALFDGVGSPFTQTFGLGLSGVVGPSEMEALEDFFQKHGAEVLHEISPMADPSLWTLLGDRGYRPIEFTNILFRPTTAELPASFFGDGRVVVRRIIEGEEALWSRLGVEGWGASPELAGFLGEIGEVMARTQGALCFLAESDGAPIATAAMGLSGGVAVLAGSSTIPSSRNRGAQQATLRARLREALEHGCDLAMMGAQPGSTSQRNAERQGFRVAYTRIKWSRRVGPSPS